MQAYITQLLADLKAAETKDRPAKPDYKILYPDHPAADPKYEGMLDHIIEWEMGISYTAETLFGISPDAFPPAEKLEAAHISAICEGILSLWEAYNTSVDFPDGCNDTLLYQYLVSEWRKGEFALLEEGAYCSKDTCDYNAELCRWGDLCTCKDLEDKWDDMPEQTPEQKAHYEKGLRHLPNGGVSWVNPDLLDENGNFDSSKFPDLPF